MLRIRLDRDSVAMGDDVDSHEVEWELPDQATVGDLVLRTGEEHYLASVGGDVAWLLEDAAGRRFALLHVDYPSGDRWVTQIGRNLKTRLTDAVAADADGIRHLQWRYLSGGARLSWDSFREWITETPEQARAREQAYAREIRRRAGGRIRAHAERRAAEAGEQPG